MNSIQKYRPGRRLGRPHPRRVEHRTQSLDEGVEPCVIQDPVQTLEEWMPGIRRQIRRRHPQRRPLSSCRSLAHRHGRSVYGVRSRRGQAGSRTCATGCLRLTRRWSGGVRVAQQVDQRGADIAENSGPIAGCGLSEQAHRRIPGRHRRGRASSASPVRTPAASRLAGRARRPGGPASGRPPQPHEHRAASPRSFQVVRLEGPGRAIVLRRALMVAGVLERVAQVVVEFGAPRADARALARHREPLVLTASDRNAVPRLHQQPHISGARFKMAR